VKFRTFGIIGYGHFGQFMARSFSSRTSEVLVTDIDADKLPKRGNGVRGADLDEVARCDVVVVAVPYSALEDALKDIRDLLPERTVVLDTVSTKEWSTALLANILGNHPNILATHPLFGPPSMKKMRKGQHLVVTHAVGERAEGFVRFLEKKFGLLVHRMSPEEHDRTMAYMQALPFFIARALVDLDILDLPHRDVLSLPSFEKLTSIASIEMHHTDAMFDTSQRSNPFASDARRAFIEVLSKLNEEIAAGHVNFRAQVHADPSALRADQPSPELAPDPQWRPPS
jgi:prephenate dehydrogenase